MSQWQEFKARIDALRDQVIKWVNYALGSIALVDWSGALATFPQVQQYLPPHLAQYALVTMGMLNWVSHNFLKHRSP